MRGPGEEFLEEVPRSPKQFRVLIVDHVFHEDNTVRNLISSEPDFNILAETHGSAQMQTSIQQYKPHLVVLDVSLMGECLHLLQQLRQGHKYKPVLVISDIEDPMYGLQVLREKANGYMVKREAPAYLVAAMKRVMLGEIYVSASVRDHIFRHIDREVHSGPQKMHLVDHLCNQVAALHSFGLDKVQISKFLKLPMPQLMVLLEGLVEESFILHPPAGAAGSESPNTQKDMTRHNVVKPRHF